MSEHPRDILGVSGPGQLLIFRRSHCLDHPDYSAECPLQALHLIYRRSVALLNLILMLHVVCISRAVLLRFRFFVVCVAPGLGGPQNLCRSSHQIRFIRMIFARLAYRNGPFD